MGHTLEQAKTFIKQIAPLIQSEAKKRGYLVCSPVIAQAILESDAGTSSLGYKYHNYFGLKCGSAWKGKSVNMKTKEEYTVGTLTTIKDNFRAYDSMEAGVKGYFDFVSATRYSNLKTASTPKKYLELIKTDGYATASTYVMSNMAVVEKYSLTSWDGKTSNATIATNKNPYDEPIGTLRIGATGTGVRWLQWQLTRRGYTLAIDGIFGENTRKAVLAFQADQVAPVLAVDGIAGRLTREALKYG